ncbi:hypothetical protein ACIG3E_26115 [Streptomyces sp. NPDC053474]
MEDPLRSDGPPLDYGTGPCGPPPLLAGEDEDEEHEPHIWRGID